MEFKIFKGLPEAIKLEGNSMRKTRLIIAGLFLLGPLSAQAIPAFTNASFETGTDAGWNVVNPFLGVTSNLGGIPASDGIFSVWFGALDNGGSSYGQTVGGFTIGQAYTLTFGMIPEHGSNADRDPTRTVATTLLSLTGANVASQSFSADCADPNDGAFFSCAPGWQDKSLTFTAQSTSIDFTWTADLVNSPRSWEFGFDNVRLESVPEPSILSLLGAGLFGFGLMRRRRRT